MLPKTHFILGLIFSLILLLVFQEIGAVGFLIVLASSVLIDIDHYLFYVFLKKDVSLKNSYKWFLEYDKKFKSLSKEQKIEYTMGVYLFHGIESILILILFFILTSNTIFVYILIGFIFHQILDFIDLYKKRMKFYKLSSFIYSIHKNRGKRHLSELK